MPNVSADIITMVAVGAGALVLLAVTQPRWDTGSGFMMLIILGGVFIPAVGSCLHVHLRRLFGGDAWRIRMVVYPSILVDHQTYLAQVLL
jgi:hypothetical protein